jgi:hypothetical protein
VLYSAQIKQREARASPRKRGAATPRKYIITPTKEKPAAWIQTQAASKNQPERHVKRNPRAGVYQYRVWHVGMASYGKELPMFMLNQAAAPQPRYQAIPAGRFSMRRLTSWQYALLALCQTPVTLAELAEATRAPASELSEALRFLCAHALVKSTTASG